MKITIQTKYLLDYCMKYKQIRFEAYTKELPAGFNFRINSVELAEWINTGQLDKDALFDCSESVDGTIIFVRPSELRHMTDNEYIDDIFED